MRYSEKKYDFQIENPAQLIVMIAYTVVSAPFRLLSEIAKKVVFLGDSTKKFFMFSLFLNMLIIVITVLKDLFIDKRINLLTGRLSVGSLIVSVVISLALFILFMQFKEDVSVDDEYEEVCTKTSPKENIAESDEMISLLDELDKIDSQEENSTLTEMLSSMDDSSSIGDRELDVVMDNLPKEKVDPIYSHESECSDRIMARRMKKQSSYDMSDFDLEIMKSLEDDKISDRRLGETLGVPTDVVDSFDYTSIDGERMLEAISEKRDSQEDRTKLFMEELNNLS